MLLLLASVLGLSLGKSILDNNWPDHVVAYNKADQQQQCVIIIRRLDPGLYVKAVPKGDLILISWNEISAVRSVSSRDLEGCTAGNTFQGYGAGT